AHLLIGERLHAVLLFRPPNHRVQPHITGSLLLEHPDVATMAVLDLGLAPLEFSRHMAVEGAPRLDGMVVDADKNEIFKLHFVSPSGVRRAGIRGPCGSFVLVQKAHLFNTFFLNVHFLASVWSGALNPTPPAPSGGRAAGHR